ncbi:MAG TPA: hypothetical protein VNT79_11145, partial [Phycisphaerae bacterium]|nr:hypothetical protein [Phycisphaerae bacterium]
MQAVHTADRISQKILLLVVGQLIFSILDASVGSFVDGGLGGGAIDQDLFGGDFLFSQVADDVLDFFD